MPVFERLTPLADAIESLEAPWVSAWQAAGEEAEGFQPLLDATAKFNGEIEKHIGAIAEITGNSADTLRSVFKPVNAGSVWFSGIESPSTFLRKVAEHGSFSLEYIVEKEMAQTLAKWVARAREEDAKRASSGENVLSHPMEAMEAIFMGSAIPRLKAEHAVRTYSSSLTPLEEKLKREGVLQEYSGKGYPDRVSARRDFAFFVADKDGGPDVLHFWPKGRAANHIVKVPMVSVEPQALPQAPTEQRSGPRP